MFKKSEINSNDLELIVLTLLNSTWHDFQLSVFLKQQKLAVRKINSHKFGMFEFFLHVNFFLNIDY